MALASFDELETPEQFGAGLNPPRSARTIYDWMSRPNGLPYVTLPSGVRRIHRPSALAHILASQKQAAPRRQGRRASGKEAA
jgi:hypothetical protein